MRRRAGWLIPVALWLIPLIGVGGPVYHLLTTPAMPPEHQYGADVHDAAPGPAWWACVTASLLTPLAIAIITGRTFSTLAGGSFILLVVSLLLWNRSLYHQDAIVFAARGSTGHRTAGTYVGFISAGGGFAIAVQRHPFRLYIGIAFPYDREPNPSVWRHTNEFTSPGYVTGLTFHYETFVAAERNGGFALAVNPAGPTGLVANTRFALVLPYWAPSLVFAVVSATWLVRQTVRFRRRSVASSSLCPACGYDLRATPDCCPECGRRA
ncbi:MAG: hypothetical protein ACAI43_05780 [Phycisphaerae bacterium]|nr:hypothetical protein [Tepidisphaeraceae bacterium]